MSHTLIDVGHIRWAGCCVEVPRETPTSDPRALDFALSGLDGRALARRAALPAVLAIAAVTAVVLLQSHVHVLADSLRRVLDLNPAWALAAIVLECLSLAGYVALLWLVAGGGGPPRAGPGGAAAPPRVAAPPA